MNTAVDKIDPEDNDAVQTPEVEDTTADPLPAPEVDDTSGRWNDGLPEEFTLDDLEGLSKAEIAAIISDQEAEKEAAAEPEPEVAPVEAAPEPKPQAFDVPDVTDATAKATKAENDRKALLEDYKRGDIDDDAFTEQLGVVDETLIAAKVEINTAKSITDSNQRSTEDVWYSKMDAFHEQHPELMSDGHRNGWDRELRTVTSQNPEMAMDTAIKLAHSRYAITADAMGNPLGVTPAQPSVAEQKLEVRTDERPAPPQTLARTPAADLSKPGEGRFGALDSAVQGVQTGDDLRRAERAIEAMNPDDLDAYLQSA
jgi:hypothetical protein